jgi:single-strand DNA-binding protein
LDVVGFKKTAEIMGQYIKKGTLFGVSGYLSARTWEDKSGQKRKTTEVVCVNITFLEPKREESAPATARVQTNPTGAIGNGEDDDIPF